MLHYGPRRRGMDLDQTQVLLAREGFTGLCGKRWRRDGLYKQLGNLFGGFSIHLLVDADDSTERGDGIRGQGLAVGLEHGCPGGSAARIGVFDDGHGGRVGGGGLQVADQLPASVEVDEIVEAELLALKLRSARDAQTR